MSKWQVAQKKPRNHQDWQGKQVEPKLIIVATEGIYEGIAYLLQSTNSEAIYGTYSLQQQYI